MRLSRLAAICCFFVTVPSMASWQDLIGRDHAIATLLLSGSDGDVRLGAKSVYSGGSRRQEIYDLVAEVTWSGCSGKRKMYPDALSWLAKALGSSKQMRFAGLLDYCLANVTEGETKSHIQEARAGLTGETTGAFEGGKIDLQQARVSLKKSISSAGRDQSARHLDGLRKFQTLDDVYSLLGVPDEVSVLAVPGEKVGFGAFKVQTYVDLLVIRYQDLVTLRFSSDDGKTDWKLDEASSAGRFWSKRDGRFVIIDHQIANGDGAQLREIADYLITRGGATRDRFDRAAERLHKSRDDQDEHLADGLAWLCRVLASSGSGRYKQFLLDLSNTAASKKVRKYAAKGAADLPETAGDRYVPGIE